MLMPNADLTLYAQNPAINVNESANASAWILSDLLLDPTWKL